MTENFIFSYKNKKQKCEDCVFDYKELEEKFISTFGLEKDIISHLKFYLDGKEITPKDDLMDLIKPDNIIDVKNIIDEIKVQDEVKNEKEIKMEEKENNNVNETIKNKDIKDMDSYLSQKFEEYNKTLEKIIMEKNEEKIQSLKVELSEEIEKKITNIFIENEINKKMIDIESKLNKLNQDYIDFKSIKIKYFNKFIEIFENKSIPQILDSSKIKQNEPSLKNEQNEPSSKNEEIENLKEQNNRLKAMIKKLKKENDDLKNKFENELLNNTNSDDISSKLENIKKENEKLKEEKENLSIKIKNLENDIKKKSENNELKSLSKSSSTKISKKKCKLICKKDNIYEYDEISENELVELNLTIKNEGEDSLPKNCEIQLMNEIDGLNLEKFLTKNNIKESEEITIKFKLDINIIKINEEMDIKLKLVDENKKDVPGGKIKLNIKIIKKEKIIENGEQENDNNITLEESDYEELYNHVNDILQIETMGENMSSFKVKLSKLLDDKKDKYESITEKTDYIEKLKEDLEEVFQ